MTGQDEREGLCALCGGANGAHGLIHTRYGNGGGGNKPCPNSPGQDEREVPNMEYLTAWARREFGVSNGTQMWVEFQGSAEMLAKAVLDILPPQITPTAEAKAEALEEAADYWFETGVLTTPVQEEFAAWLRSRASLLRETGGA